MADGPCSDSNQVSVGIKSVRIDSDDKNIKFSSCLRYCREAFKADSLLFK